MIIIFLTHPYYSVRRLINILLLLLVPNAAGVYATRISKTIKLKMERHTKTKYIL